MSEYPKIEMTTERCPNGCKPGHVAVAYAAGHDPYLAICTWPGHTAPTPEIPRDLDAVLRDQSVIVSQDAGVFERMNDWMNAPSNTASATPTPETPSGSADTPDPLGYERGWAEKIERAKEARRQGKVLRRVAVEEAIRKRKERRWRWGRFGR